MQKEKRKILSQWLFPAIVLVAVISAMLINFVNQSSEFAKLNVEEDMFSVVERLTTDFQGSMSAITRTAAPVGLAIAQAGEENTELLAELCKQAPVYLVVYCNANGVGTTHDGEAVNLSEEGYFAQFDEKPYVFVADDKITGAEAVARMIKVPDDSGDMIIAYYPTENLSNSVSTNDFDGDFFYMLIDEDGNVLIHSEHNSRFLEGDNLFSTLGASYDEEVSSMQVRLNNGISGITKVTVDDEARSLVYKPLSINHWTMLIGVDEDDVDRLETKEWDISRSTLFQLVIALSAFVIIMVIINMFTKIRSTENTKELMEKADTDLLTGLNNKLATERKIKEFMESHPNDQSMIFVLDIDNFKKINDTMGHAFGDEVLRSLGQQITAMFRVTDIVGRVGGDEFIIFLKNLRDDELVRKEAVKVARFFHDFKTGEYVKYSATASIGVAVFPRDGKDFESMYKAADQALYMAKKRGKNQLAFYHDSIEAVVIK
jgi:diguanylate cyclase (GGDEF)-like protein